MITKERISAILKLALPITIGLGSSFIMVLIDLAMVGSLGNHAIAALGLSGFTNTFILALVIGVAPAVQGLVARRRGEGSKAPKCLPLNGGLLLVLVIGTPLSVLCYALCPFYFEIISSDPGVTKEGIPYLRALFTAVVAVGMNNAFRGHWTGLDRAKLYMQIVLIINCLNIFLNYVLIFGNLGAPALGTTGAGIASAASLYTGTVIYFVVTFMHSRTDGFLRTKVERPLLSRIFKMGLPATLQEIFFSAGYITFFWMVGQVGTAELAAANVLVRVTLVLILFAMALGMSSATLVSNAVGKGDLAGATQWGWDVGKVGVVWISILGLPLLLFPQAFLSLFIPDPETIAIAIVPLQLVAATTGIGSLIHIFAYTLYSLGDGSRVVMVSFSTQWLVFLPAVWFIGPHLGYGLLEIWLVQMVYGLTATVLIVAIWVDARWKRIKI